MPSPQIPDAPIENRIRADVCAGDTRIAVADDSRQDEVNRDGPYLFFGWIYMILMLCFADPILEEWLQRPPRLLRRELVDNLLKERRHRQLKELLRGQLKNRLLQQRCEHTKRAMISACDDSFTMGIGIAEAFLHNSVLAHKAPLCLASVRYSADHDLCSKLPWALRFQIIQEISSSHRNLHKVPSPFSIHMDLKPPNILLDEDCTSRLSDFGILKLLHCDAETPVPMSRAVGIHNSPFDVEFEVADSAKGGTEIKIGSHVIHAPKYLSVRHPLLQMVLFARNKFDDTFACLKSVALKSIFDMANRLCPSASPNVCGASWISARPKSESPKVGTVSEFNIRKSIGRRNKLTENESHHSDPDSCRAEHGIKASAIWLIATAAPHHATGNSDLLSGFITKHDNQFVHAVDGVPMKVLAHGAVVTEAVALPDVWFVPGLTANLVSVSQLADLDYSIGFGCGECCIRNSADGKIVGKARLQEGGHYVLDFLKVPLAM